MDGLREFLEAVRLHRLDSGRFQAILHICVGRTISRTDGTVLSKGITWRQLAELLRLMRWDKESVEEIGLTVQDLPPRDRARYWYSAIAAAKLDSEEARNAADVLIPQLKKKGFVVT